MKKNRKKPRNPATVELIAERFKKSVNYVKCVLKVGDINDEYFERISKGRIALYVAYSQAIADERKEKQKVPDPSDANEFTADPKEEPTLDPTHVAETKETTGSEPQSGSTTGKDDSQSNTKLPEDRPTLDPTQVKAPVDAITVADDGTIEFSCPCGCNQKYVINLNTSNDE